MQCGRGYTEGVVLKRDGGALVVAQEYIINRKYYHTFYHDETHLERILNKLWFVIALLWEVFLCCQH